MADRPIADLPDEIRLTRDEAATVLFALDVVDSAVPDGDDAEKVRRAVRLLTRKLWRSSASFWTTMARSSLKP
jgi:hypothetical protein